jgi:hypothetical protein
MSMIVAERCSPYEWAISNTLIEPKQQELTMKLSHVTTAIFVSASAIFSAQAQAQTISVNPQTLIMNFAPGENLLARLAQATPGQVAAITSPAPATAATPTPAAAAPVPAPPAAVAPVAAPAIPVSAPVQAQAPVSVPVSAPAPVDVPAVIGGQKIGADAQRVTKCLIENHGDRYVCGMQELNGEISKCVGGVGTPGGCFTAPLTRARDTAPVQVHRHYTTRYYGNRYYAHYMNFF